MAPAMNAADLGATRILTKLDSTAIFLSDAILNFPQCQFCPKVSFWTVLFWTPSGIFQRCLTAMLIFLVAILNFTKMFTIFKTLNFFLVLTDHKFETPP